MNETDLERFRRHSVELNAIGFRLAEAVGDVGPEDDWVIADPQGRLTRLIAERDDLRGRLAAVEALCDPRLDGRYGLIRAEQVRAAARGGHEVDSGVHR